MNAFAAVMTGKGIGAIATICISGEHARDIVKDVFKPIINTEVHFDVGQILLGDIVDNGKVIDQAIVGCEKENEFAINCHGNRLIIEKIMELLAKCGAEPVNAERFLELSISKSQIADSIALEANLGQLKVRTIEGYKLLQYQIEQGLSAKIRDWQKTNSLDHVKLEAKNVIETSQPAKYIIFGCKVVIAGPANSGKSTLLNCLAGREKSIIADIAGTTRDWVSTTCISGPLAMEIFDTAGLDESLVSESPIDKAAQDRSIELLKNADVVLWVVDGNDENVAIEFRMPDYKNQIIVINKSDLDIKVKTSSEQAVLISAKNGTGIELLTAKIRIVLGLERFDLKQAVCFTGRQHELLEKLCTAKDLAGAQLIITELLNGPVSV